MNFTGKIIVERSTPGQRASVKEQGFYIVLLTFNLNFLVCFRIGVNRVFHNNYKIVLLIFLTIKQ